jgi:hypothetical protein
MAITTIDNFNSYSDGDLNGQGTWSGHVGFDVQGSVVQEGAKAVTGNTAGQVINLNVTDRTTGIFRCYMKVTTGISSGPSFRLNDSGIGMAFDVQIQSGKWKLRNTINTPEIIGDPTVDQWDLLEIEIDSSANTARARLNGGTWTATMTHTFTSITDIDLESTDNVSSSLAHWDLIQYDDGVAASGPANLKSLDTNLKANIKSYNTNVIANVKSINTNV